MQDRQYAADVASAMAYLTQQRGPEFVANICAWEARVFERIQGEGEPFTADERQSCIKDCLRDEDANWSWEDLDAMDDEALAQATNDAWWFCYRDKY